MIKSLLKGNWVLTKATGRAEILKHPEERDYWIKTLIKIVSPVLQALATEKLKFHMPVETLKEAEHRRSVTHLEAFGRSLAGLAPWLELGSSETEEGKLRSKFIGLSVSAIRNAVNPASPDFLNFTEGTQPLVDTAFFAQALLRAPKQLWNNLDATTQQNVITALKSTRTITAHRNNWLLFPAMIETALLKFDQQPQHDPIEFAVTEHEKWYLGDGCYRDGPKFRFDYYNSFVIQPMLIDIVQTVYDQTGEMKDLLDKIVSRAERYAVIQEHFIAPDGSYPPIGRSLPYRCGAFQLLAQMALQGRLPDNLPPNQVRSALTAVITRTLEAPGTFDRNGWLRIGLCGHQPGLAENYISTGSLYLCSVAFLPLGLPADDVFWTTPSCNWTSKQVFEGGNIGIDKSLDVV
jgi:hypothetical protein